MAPKSKSKDQNVRLPNWFKPERYVLELEPAIEEATFRGSEVLHYTLTKATTWVTLHATELGISKVSAVVAGKTFDKPKITYSKKNETVTFTFKKPLPKGKGRLYLSFKGILNDRMHGFYRSSYLHEGHQRFLATTQFEATDARRAFPCVDEPAAKAVFEVTITAPEKLSVISNTVETAIEKIDTRPGYKTVMFAPSPKMSTYLLAFIVGDFEYVQGKTKRGVTVRVFVTPGKKAQTTFALDTAIKCLDFYEKYFDIPYPLPLLDLIAIPDFAAGAMENWGAVTYRESALLFDEEHSSLGNKQRVAIVIAHELAHQWFGNLVTMEWWTDLWLNEGFASYMEYLAVDYVFPKWDIWTQFVNDDMGSALRLDALYHTHPIEIEVGHPAEIDEIFDAVSYSKGASLIRMLAHYLGEKDFRAGLRSYLKKHAHQNAVTQDLWKAFEKQSGKPVRAFMNQWTGKGGYPIIKVFEEKERLRFEQSRFFMSPLSKAKTKDATLWQVPINILSKNKKKSSLLLTKRIGELPAPKAEWVKVNPGETGFFRVDYASPILMNLKPAILDKELPAVDRLAMIRDAFALAESGESPTTDALNLLTAYKHETDYTVWLEIASGLGALKKILHGSPAYPQFEKYCQKIFLPTAERLGWTVKRGEVHTETLLRELVLTQLISLGHAPTIRKGRALYTAKHIPTDLRSVAYFAAAKSGGSAQHTTFIRKYTEATSQQEQSRLGRALGAFDDEKLLAKTLEFMMSKQVRPQDTVSLAHAVWANPLGRRLAWESLKRNWNELVRRYTITSRMLSYFIMGTALFVSEKDADTVERFFKKTKLFKTNRALAQSLEKIRANAAWVNRDRKLIEKWLEEEVR